MIPNLLDINDFQMHPCFVKSEEFGNDLLDDIVSFEQENILIDLLGQAEFQKFTADYSGSELVWDSQEWIDFVDGVAYTITDVTSTSITINWTGIKNVIKYFVYVKWLNQAGEYNNNTGASRATNENATVRNKTAQAVLNQNEGIKKYGVDWSGYFYKQNYGFNTFHPVEILSLIHI